MKWFFSLLKDLGFDVILFIAGVSGAIAFLPKNTTKSKLEKFISVISGGLAANYLTPLFGSLLNLNNDGLYGLAFLVGYGGLKSVELAWQYLASKFSKENGSNSIS